MTVAAPPRPHYRAVHRDSDEYAELTGWEFDGATGVGQERDRTSREQGHTRPLEAADDKESRYNNWIGPVGERAVAKVLGIYWPGHVLQRKDESDLPHNIEVRVLGADWYGLRVKPNDPDDVRVVGIVIEKGNERHQQGGFRVPGWCYAGEAKRPEWQIRPRGGPPMWAAPQGVEVVRPLFEIRQLIVVERAAGLLDGLPTPNLERPS